MRKVELEGLGGSAEDGDVSGVAERGQVGGRSNDINFFCESNFSGLFDVVAVLMFLQFRYALEI